MKDKIQKYTPMMEQYLAIKKDYADSIVFFRLGDFYEMFFDDAYKASAILEIALTGRDAGMNERVPMCGVPHHAAESYIQKLIEKGMKVALAEQVEEVGASKGIVKRDVVKVITPGTFFEGALLNRENIYIGSITQIKEGFYFSFADFSTGEVNTSFYGNDFNACINEVINLNIKELVVSNNFNLKLLNNLLKSYQILISKETNQDLSPELLNLTSELKEDYQIPVALLINYIIGTQKKSLSHFQKINVIEPQTFLKIDYYSKKNLEINETLRSGNKTGSLLNLLDQCQTAMGSRNLRKWLERPLLSYLEINKRLTTVEALINDFIAREEMIKALKNIYDLERIVGKISVGNVNGRDLFQLKKSVGSIPLIIEKIQTIKTPLALELAKDIDKFEDLYERLECSLVDNPPLTIKEGGIFKEGCNSELDELLKIKKHGKDYILEMERNERERTGIKNLKIGYNRIFGYYIEVLRSGLDLVANFPEYERKQTVANAERFVTQELKEKQELILGAEDKLIKLEYQLFLELREYCAGFIKKLQVSANLIAQIDCLIAFAIVSEKNRYIKPEISSTREMKIKNGRHPTIELLLERPFVTNDIYLKDYNFLLITGPNMSGKSTYMRQIALIVIMAQIGCFVPADEAYLPIFDQIFTRIGAADDLINGQSTFMVEMIEANNALQNATEKSLILFDEIGRGTATFDGLALAQAIAEYIHEKIKCTTLFSTHYHELIHLETNLKRLKNVHVTAKEDKAGLTFLHKVTEGPSDKSFGINVASLAKLPKSLIARSTDILNELEKEKQKYSVKTDLFSFADFEEPEEIIEEVIRVDSEVVNLLRDLDINDLTPLAALNLINELKKKAEDE